MGRIFKHFLTKWPTLNGERQPNLVLWGHRPRQEDQHGPCCSNMNLTRLEHFTLANQFKILAKLYPQEADFYVQHQKIMEDGYSYHYDDCMENISGDELSEEQCKEVLDILEMHSNLIISWGKLKDKAGITEEDVRFRGFDGNNESHYMGYASFFLNDMNRYDELPHGAAKLNSHMATLWRYSAMLQKWRELGKENHSLTAEQIRSILDAPKPKK
jgi:uncharacterized protein